MQVLHSSAIFQSISEHAVCLVYILGSGTMKTGQRIVRVKRNYLHKAIVIFSVLVFIPFFMHPTIFIY